MEMGYSPEAYEKAELILSEYRRAASVKLLQRTEELNNKIPEIKDIEEQIHNLGIELTKAAMTSEEISVETEAKLCDLEKKKKQRTQAYTDYKNGVLDQEDYLYAKEQYQKDIDALDQELYELQHAENRTVDVILGEKNWTEIVQQYYSATEVTAELIAATIEELHLHADSTLSVKFRYDTEFRELLNEYESIRREVA